MARGRRQRMKKGAGEQPPTPFSCSLSADRLFLFCVRFLRRGRLDVRLVDHQRVGRFHFKRAGIPSYGNFVLVGQFRWHSPRVPAGEASAVFEVALRDDFARLIGNGQFRFWRSSSVDRERGDRFSGFALDGHSEPRFARHVVDA